VYTKIVRTCDRSEKLPHSSTIPQFNRRAFPRRDR
jgi:hypothetical protein